MKPIPYEQFEINPKVLKSLKEHYTNRKIKECFEQYGEWPNSGTVESFIIPSELMEKYKKYYYAEYYSTWPDYNKIPLTIEALGNGTLRWLLRDKTVRYSKNGGEWQIMDANTVIPVVEGDTVAFKANNSQYYELIESSFYGSTYFLVDYKAYGNIMSLIDGDDFENATVVGENAFKQLFAGGRLKDVSNLKLPATTLGSHCYESMFWGCDFATPPELPATTLAPFCYSAMFDACKKLTRAPKLPATILESHCYQAMFNRCDNLTTPPELPSRTLAVSCYRAMFGGCQSLIVAPELPAIVMAEDCYREMFGGCQSLVIAPKLPATTLANNCYMNMFTMCSNLSIAPELPATELSDSCYWCMFDRCTSLVNAPELPAINLVNSCYQHMFSGCINLRYIKALFTTQPVSNTQWAGSPPAENYTAYWVSGVGKLGTFVKNPDAEWDEIGANGVPEGWKIVTDDIAPIDVEVLSGDTYFVHISKGNWSEEEMEYYNQNWRGLNGLHYDVFPMRYNVSGDYYYINNVVIPENSIIYPYNMNPGIGCEIIIRRDTEIYSQPLNFITSEGLVTCGMTDIEHGKSYGYQYSPFYYAGERIDELRMSFYRDRDEDFVKFVVTPPSGGEEGRSEFGFMLRK